MLSPNKKRLDCSGTQKALYKTIGALGDLDYSSILAHKFWNVETSGNEKRDVSPASVVDFTVIFVVDTLLDQH